MRPLEKNAEGTKWQEGENVSAVWGALLFGLIGATVTTAAVFQLRKSISLIYTELNSSQSHSYWRNASRRPGSGFQEEALRRYNRRMYEKHKEEVERVERIRRMQKIFNQERIMYRRSYERWMDYEQGPYQPFQQYEWYWNAGPCYGDHNASFRSYPREDENYMMSHHYSVLGLDRSRSTPYSDAEIKMAFRAKAMKYHPDQNPDNKDVAEAKFKEVMMSYEAIKLQRKNGSC